MRQYIAAVDEELYLELVSVLREMPSVGMNEPHKRRARQLAFMSTMHAKDRALQMITQLSDPANGFGNDLCGSMRHRVQTRSKQHEWHTTHKIQNGRDMLD